MRLQRGQTFRSFAISSLLALTLADNTPTTLVEVLQTYSELSTLYSYVNASGDATSFLGNATNFTFLAPSNSAIEAQYGSLNADDFNAILQYSLLKGEYSSLSITSTPQFAPSNLDNATYANVTGGQVVDLVLDSAGNPQAVTGNKNVSTTTSSDIVVQGGIIHIMNELLTVPSSIISEITDASWEYFVSILDLGGYLSAADPYVNSVLSLTSITAFIPNSEEALAAAKQLAQNTSSAALESLFQYHVVTSGVFYSPQLTNGTQIQTAQGNNVTVTVQDGNTYIDSAKITSFDYIVANGVVHIIDSLLNPNQTYARPAAATLTAASTVSSTAASNATSTTATTLSKHHSHGRTIGIAVGVTLGGLIILGALVWFILRSRKRARESRVAQETQQTTPPNAIDTGIGRFYYIGGGNQRHQQEQQQRASQRHSMVGTGLGFKDKNALDRTNSTNSGGVATSPIVPPRSPSRKDQNGGNRFWS